MRTLEKLNEIASSKINASDAWEVFRMERKNNASNK